MVKYSCQYIDNALAFNRTDKGSDFSRVTFCNCMNSSNGLGRSPYKENYDGTPIDWDEFLAKRDEIRKNFANGIFPKECEGCYQIEEKEPETHHKIYDFAIAPWQICNSRCVYCEAEFIDKYKDFLVNYDKFHQKFVEQYNFIPILRAMVQKEILAKEARIDITGGEPTMYPRFNELLGILLDYGCKNIRILSNCIIYSPLIEKALRDDAATMIISLDAGSKELHQKVKGVSSYDIVWENIKRYAKCIPPNSKHDMDLKYILIPKLNDDKREIEKWIKKSKDSGATCVSMDVDFRVLQKVDVDKKIANKLIEMSLFAIKVAKKQKIRIYFHPNLRDIYIKQGKEQPNLD